MKPVEIYRRIEIRPDCMIIEGADIFWALRKMEIGWSCLSVPTATAWSRSLRQSTARASSGEYLYRPAFRTSFDRMPEVFAAHLQDAMTQLWARPLT